MIVRVRNKNFTGQPAVAISMTVAAVVVIWSASSYGYYSLVAAFAFDSGYNDAPFLFAGYYLLWAGGAWFWFREVLSERLGRNGIAAHGLAMLPVLAVCIIVVTVFFPYLPKVALWKAPADPPEFMFASGWYYLPKSADILFQQVLIASMIHTAARLEFRLPIIAAGMGLLFGGFHLLLALDGFSPFYVTRFTIAATLFGIAAPYLYLRQKNGFRWAYCLHWTFYAFDKTLTHFLLAAPPWMQTWL